MYLIKCDPRAKARCPFKTQCCGDDVAYFEPESECDKFNQQVLAPPPTNADRIRTMSDEEIAEWVCENGAIKTPCDIICGGDCKALATFDKSSMDVCKEIVMKWLQKPAEEDDK